MDFSADLDLDMTAWAKLAAHWRLVEEYNQKFNLTAISGWEEAAVKHYLDCLLVLPLLRRLSTEYQQRGQRLSCADIGSGAGFPGLVLAIACPESEWLLLESAAKKGGFLQLCAEKLGLKNVRVLPLRAEEAGQRVDLRASCGFVTARAVSALPVLLEYAAPLLAEGGVFAALKGPSLTEEQAGAVNAQAVLSMRLLEQQEFSLPGGGGNRFIAAYQKTAPTAAKYPRRPGMPEKRPL